MLSGTGLGDDASLTHALCQQDLADTVIDLVSTGVIEILAFKIDARASQLLGQSLGKIERTLGRPIISQDLPVTIPELLIFAGIDKSQLQSLECRHQTLRHVTATKSTEEAGAIGPSPCNPVLA